jgi:DNA repair photolyase
MNTQEIQEWEEDLETLLDHAVPQVVFEGVESLKKDVKSFISQKLKEQEERYKREIEKLFANTEFKDENGEMIEDDIILIFKDGYSTCLQDVLELFKKYEN